MRDAITENRIANSIIQRRKKYANFILVEGSHDRLFFLKFKNDVTQIELTFGWEKLINAISILKERGFDKVIGIIDKDLREIIPDSFEYEGNVILTDDHDINIICIEKSFNTIFHSYYSEDKTEKFKAEKKVNCLKEYTHQIIRPLSFLKVLNIRENLNLSFKAKDREHKGLDYSKFIDKDKYEFISLDKLIETVVNYSRNRTDQKMLSNDIILNKLKKIVETEDYQNPKLNCGHDFGTAICLGLKKVLATKDIDSEEFLKETILNFEWEDFITTNIFRSIQNIEMTQGIKYLRK